MTLLLGIWGVTLLGVVVVAIGLIVLSAQVPSQAQLVDEVTALRSPVALLHELRVQTYVDEGCRSFAYARGVFSDTAGSDCEAYIDDGQPFDQQASQDFATIRSALASTGINVWRARETLPGSYGYSIEGSCSFCPDLIYVYAPDRYTSPPNGLPYESRWFAITPDWYAWQDLEGGM